MRPAGGAGVREGRAGGWAGPRPRLGGWKGGTRQGREGAGQAGGEGVVGGAGAGTTPPAGSVMRGGEAGRQEGGQPEGRAPGPRHRSLGDLEDPQTDTAQHRDAQGRHGNRLQQDLQEAAAHHERNEAAKMDMKYWRRPSPYIFISISTVNSASSTGWPRLRAACSSAPLPCASRLGQAPSDPPLPATRAWNAHLPLQDIPPLPAPPDPVKPGEFSH